MAATDPSATDPSATDPSATDPSATDSSDIEEALAEAHSRFASDDSGEVSNLYPPLAEADPELFGLSFVDRQGQLHSAGDCASPFVLMSVAKPFTFALACDMVGVETAGNTIGVDATGRRFNSLEAVERSHGPGNPMVNAGAIATVALLGPDPWPRLVEGLSRFAGRPLSFDSAVFEAVVATNHHNRAIIHLLEALGAITGEPATALDVYSRQCCTSVTTDDLAVMGATLANGGVNPLSGERVVSDRACRATLAVMTTAGLYETSGQWFYRVQLPGKSGVSGGIVAVSPGSGALATYSPRIDDAANSVRGQQAAAHLSDRLDLGILGVHDR